MKRLTIILPLVLLAAGCGSSSTTTKPPATTRLVNPAATPYVNALEIDPANGDFLLTTNKGFWRIDKKSDKVTPIKGKISAEGKTDTVGTFLEILPDGPGRLLGSGHPDHKNTLPQFLGYLESDDSGKTWKVVSRLGDADLHKIVLAHGKLYAFDAVLGAMLISADRGRTFTERFTPRGLVIDFVVDPEDENYILAATEDQLFRTEDQGKSWRPVTSGTRIRLAWPRHDLVLRADQDGTVYSSSDRGQTFQQHSRVDGEPYKFKETDDPNHLYLALGDGSIIETTDGGKTWKGVFAP
jgi:hypothetical protein